MLYLLATPIGNLGDISIRAIETLQSCSTILCEDTRVAKKFISLLKSRDLLKRSDFAYISLHSHNEDSRIASLGLDFFNDDVIFMSDAGMPCVSDPGARLVKFMQENNLPYTIIPGVSSTLSAFALSGFEGEFSFFGFFPHKLANKRKFINEKILSNKGISICFESPHRILDTLELLCEIVPNLGLFAVKEMTKIHEKFYFGSVKEVFSQIKESNISGEWVLVLDKSSEIPPSLGLDEINSISMPPKIKAKLLAKLTNKGVEECYNEIINNGG